MEHSRLFDLREAYNEQGILLCFNGPFSQGLIEEIGNALKRYLQSETTSSTSAMDVFAVYIELAQNIQRYSAAQGYNEGEGSATVVIGKDTTGAYVIAAGNIVEPADGEALVQRVTELAALDKVALKAAYREQLRMPRHEGAAGAGLGLIDISRKASQPISCRVCPDSKGDRAFFSLRVVI